MKFETRISGTKELESTFFRLPGVSRRKAYMKSLRAGAVPVRDAAIDNLRSVSKPFSGLSHRSNTLRIYSYKKYRGMYRVGIQVRRNLTNPAKRNKAGEPVRVALYLAVMEYGSQKLNRQPRSWIRKAQREKEKQAIDSTKKEFYSLLPSIVADARMKR